MRDFSADRDEWNLGFFMFKQIFFRGIRLVGYCTAIALLGTTSHVFAGAVKFPNGE